MESGEQNKQGIEYIRDLIEKAKSEAPQAEDLETNKDTQDKLLADFIAGKISGEEYESREKPEPRGSIEFESEDEFGLALSILGFSREMIDDLTSHEIEHYLEAEKDGFKPTLMIQFFRGENGKLSLYPSVEVAFPKDMMDDQIRIALKKTISAAKDLSPRDQSQLNDH